MPWLLICATERARRTHREACFGLALSCSCRRWEQRCRTLGLHLGLSPYVPSPTGCSPCVPGPTGHRPCFLGPIGPTGYSPCIPGPTGHNLCVSNNNVEEESEPGPATGRGFLCGRGVCRACFTTATALYGQLWTRRMMCAVPPLPQPSGYTLPFLNSWN